jgi:hypothetical protein
MYGFGASLPPAAALDALEELGQGRLKRHNLMLDVIVIPAVLQPDWLRKFVKVTDLYFFIPSGAIPEWPLTCMKLSPLVYISLSSDSTRGNGRIYHSWVDLEARCQRCNTLTRQMEGIFCANFGQPVLGLPLCHRAWCAACYQQRPCTIPCIIVVLNLIHFNMY